MSEPVEVQMKDADGLIGRFIVVWRNNAGCPVRVYAVDKAAKRIKYEVMGGPDKGLRFSSRYDDKQTGDSYDDGNFVLALLATGQEDAS